MKSYQVFSKQDLDQSLDDLKNLYRMATEIRGKEAKITIKVSRYKKPKSSAQHRKYWKCISEMKKAFLNSGIETNEEEVHQFVKTKSGFTKILHGEMVTRSIADMSEDATSAELNRLIEFIVIFCAQELNYQIDESV